MLAGRRSARRADRHARPRRQLLAGRPGRAVRAVLGALPRSRRRLRRPRRSSRRRQRPFPRVLEPRLHAVRAEGRRLAAGVADAVDRHGARARSPGGDRPGRAVGLRHRLHAPADRPRRGALGALLRRRLRDHPRAAHPRRPRARHDLPDRRRRRPLERGPRLRAAADNAPGDPAGAQARDRRTVPAEPLRARERGRGRRLSRAAIRARDDLQVGVGRGGELRAHARAGRAAAGRSGATGQGGGHVVGRARGGLPAARHVRIPLRADARAARRAGPRGRRCGLRRADGSRTPGGAGGAGGAPAAAVTSA